MSYETSTLPPTALEAWLASSWATQGIPTIIAFKRSLMAVSHKTRQAQMNARALVELTKYTELSEVLRDLDDDLDRNVDVRLDSATAIRHVDAVLAPFYRQLPKAIRELKTLEVPAPHIELLLLHAEANTPVHRVATVAVTVMLAAILTKP